MKYIKLTKKEFEDKLQQINETLYPYPISLRGDNYCLPLIKGSDYYMLLSDEVLSFFTEKQLSTAIEYEDLNIL